MAKVFLGVGHGGKDPGAVANGFKESQFNLDVAKSCAEELKRHGVVVKLSRETDASENLAQRIKECKAFKPDLAGDIHFNAGGGDGAEVYHKKTDKTDDELAKNILAELEKIGQNSRGMKTKTYNGDDYFGFVREMDCPSVLVECAFIDNKADIKIADTLAKRKKMGEAIAKGFLKTLKIAYKPKNDFLTTKGYLHKGDSGKSVEKLCDFFANNVKGDYFGDYLEACVKVFQKQNGLTQDGKFTETVLKKLAEKGFKY